MMAARQARRRRGSMALFLCLTLSAALLYCDILLSAARLRVAETGLARALAAQIQISLANYDVPLREFGLFAFTAGTLDPYAFRAALPAGFPETSCIISPEKPVGDPFVLRPQIIRYMKARVPAVAANLLLSRLSGLSSLIRGDYQPAAGTGDMAGQTAGKAGGGIAGLIHALTGGLPAAGVRLGAQVLFGESLDKLEDQAIHELESTYRQYSAEWLGVGSPDSLCALFGRTPDLLAPASLEELAATLERLLDFHTTPIYEKICLIEYVLGQFKPCVQKMATDTGEVPLRTLDGRLFNSFAEARQAEAEMILTGLSSPGSASQAVRVMIICLRCLVHLADILSNEQEMAGLKASAATVAAAVTTLTGGAVTIDPQVVLYLITTGKALRNAMLDYGCLTSGRSLELLPGQTGDVARLYYQDYLRLLLLLVPTATLVERIAARISQVMPGRFTALTVTANFRGRRYSLSGGYDGQPDHG